MRVKSREKCLSVDARKSSSRNDLKSYCKKGTLNLINALKSFSINLLVNILVNHRGWILLVI